MGKRFIFILMACSLLSIATVVHAQHIDKQTYTFAIKKADTLNVSALIAIGHPAIQPTAPARKSVQELIQYR